MRHICILKCSAGKRNCVLFVIYHKDRNNAYIVRFLGVHCLDTRKPLTMTTLDEWIQALLGLVHVFTLTCLIFDSFVKSDQTIALFHWPTLRQIAPIIGDFPWFRQRCYIALQTSWGWLRNKMSNRVNKLSVIGKRTQQHLTFYWTNRIQIHEKSIFKRVYLAFVHRTLRLKLEKPKQGLIKSLALSQQVKRVTPHGTQFRSSQKFNGENPRRQS